MVSIFRLFEIAAVESVALAHGVEVVIPHREVEVQRHPRDLLVRTVALELRELANLEASFISRNLSSPLISAGESIILQSAPAASAAGRSSRDRTGCPEWVEPLHVLLPRELQ